MIAFAVLFVVASNPDAGAITRLDLALTWEAAQLFHPAVMHREAELDSAFIAAVKALDLAKTPDERRAALGLILTPLNDPSSRIVTEAPPPPPGPFAERDGGFVVLHAAAAQDDEALWDSAAGELTVADAGQIVVDLRGVQAGNPVLGWSIVPSKDIALPATQSIAHVGYDSDQPSSYGARLELTPGAVVKGDPRTEVRRFGIILGASDPVPDWAIALRQSGQAIFVSYVQLTDDGALMGLTLPLGDGAAVRVRTTEYVGVSGLVATDVVVPRGQDALVVARAALVSRSTPKLRSGAPVPVPTRTFSLGPVTKDFPDREHRMLAALRLWTVARRFWAYPYLRTINANQALLSLLTKLETTTTPEAYRDAVGEAAVGLVPDSHVSVSLMGRPSLWPPFDVRIVEGRFLITEVTPNAGPLQRGDELVELDGQKFTDLVAARFPYIAGSRDDGRRQQAMENVLFRGPGTAKVTVAHPGGKRETAELTWSQANGETLFATPKPGPHFRVLPGKLGFIDLVNLEPAEVDAAMDDVKDTKGLLIDLRGYPNGTAFAIGPRLGAKKNIPGVAAFCFPIVRAGSEAERKCEASLQQLPAWEGRRYTAPVVVLIDLDAISQSEHSCLIFEAYTQVTFVGSPTRGANGNVSHVDMPGTLRMSFTGLEVKHADGRQAQSVGIQPQVISRPTVAGLRAGKDEVLEKGVWVLKQKMAR